MGGVVDQLCTECGNWVQHNTFALPNNDVNFYFIWRNALLKLAVNFFVRWICIRLWRRNFLHCRDCKCILPSNLGYKGEQPKIWNKKVYKNVKVRCLCDIHGSDKFGFLQLIWECCILCPIVFRTWRRGVISSHACNAVQQSVNTVVGFQVEDGGSTCLRNTGTDVPKCRASCTSRIASSVTLSGPSQFPNTSMGRPTGGALVFPGYRCVRHVLVLEWCINEVYSSELTSLLQLQMTGSHIYGYSRCFGVHMETPEVQDKYTRMLSCKLDLHSNNTKTTIT